MGDEATLVNVHVPPPPTHRCQVACQAREAVHVAGDEAALVDVHVHGPQHVRGVHAAVVRVVQVAKLQAAQVAGQGEGGEGLMRQRGVRGGARRGTGMLEAG